MPKVLVSNNAELLRHFTAPPFVRLGLEVFVAKTADEARSLFLKEEPSLVVLDVELPDSLDVAHSIKHQNKATRVILVAGRRLSGDQMREISACGCDELLIAPMTADELMTAAQAATLKELAEAAYELDAFKPNLTRTEAEIRIAMLTAKLKLLDGPPHTL